MPTNYAQHAQDLAVLKHYGKDFTGYFIEIGANDGKTLSNTLLLEEYGWTGFLVEADPATANKIPDTRNAPYANIAVSKEHGTATFLQHGVTGGIHDYIQKPNVKANGRKITVKTTPLHDLLLTQGCPKRIDFLSIDIEGAEYDVLSVFPFEQWDIGYLLVEHNDYLRKTSHKLIELCGKHFTSHWIDRLDVHFIK